MKLATRCSPRFFRRVLLGPVGLFFASVVLAGILFFAVRAQQYNAAKQLIDARASRLSTAFQRGFFITQRGSRTLAALMSPQPLWQPFSEEDLLHIADLIPFPVEQWQRLIIPGRIVMVDHEDRARVEKIVGRRLGLWANSSVEVAPEAPFYLVLMDETNPVRGLDITPHTNWGKAVLEANETGGIATAVLFPQFSVGAFLGFIAPIPAQWKGKMSETTFDGRSFAYILVRAQEALESTLDRYEEEGDFAGEIYTESAFVDRPPQGSGPGPQMIASCFPSSGEDVAEEYKHIETIKLGHVPLKLVFIPTRRLVNSYIWFWTLLVGLPCCVVVFGTVSALLLGCLTLQVENSIKARRVAECALSSRNKFLAYLCHELRNPLNAIHGLLEFLRETGLSSEQSEHVAAMESSFKHMSRIINDTLDLGKLEAGKAPMDRKEFDHSAMLLSVFKFYEPVAQRRGVTLVLKACPGLPRLVYSDETRAMQMLCNLLSNGLKVTKPGGTVALLVRLIDPVVEGATEIENFAQQLLPLPPNSAVIRHGNLRKWKQPLTSATAAATTEEAEEEEEVEEEEEEEKEQDAATEKRKNRDKSSSDSSSGCFKTLLDLAKAVKLPSIKIFRQQHQQQQQENTKSMETIEVRVAPMRGEERKGEDSNSSADNLSVNSNNSTSGGKKGRKEGRLISGVLEVQVLDTGAGIPAEVLPQIFVQYSQPVPTLDGTGTGLGLSFIKAIATCCGGDITVRTQPGLGTQFSLRVPIYFRENVERVGNSLNRTSPAKQRSPRVLASATPSMKGPNERVNRKEEKEENPSILSSLPVVPLLKSLPNSPVAPSSSSPSSETLSLPLSSTCTTPSLPAITTAAATANSTSPHTQFFWSSCKSYVPHFRRPSSTVATAPSLSPLRRSSSDPFPAASLQQLSLPLAHPGPSQKQHGDNGVMVTASVATQSRPVSVARPAEAMQSVTRVSCHDGAVTPGSGCQQQQGAVTAHSSLAEGAGGACTVLAVDDAEINRKILCRKLSKMGCTVLTAANGKEAIELIQQGGREIHLILMDLQMPVMDGAEAAGTLKALGCTIPIVAVTGSVTAEEKARMMQSGMREVVAKPLKDEELLAVIRRYVPAFRPLL